VRDRPVVPKAALAVQAVLEEFVGGIEVVLPPINQPHGVKHPGSDEVIAAE
jgi:hypothetical protein